MLLTTTTTIRMIIYSMYVIWILLLPGTVTILAKRMRKIWFVSNTKAEQVRKKKESVRFLVRWHLLLDDEDDDNDNDDNVDENFFSKEINLKLYSILQLYTANSEGVWLWIWEKLESFSFFWHSLAFLFSHYKKYFSNKNWHVSKREKKRTFFVSVPRDPHFSFLALFHDFSSLLSTFSMYSVCARRYTHTP